MNFLKKLALVLIGICLYFFLSVLGMLIWVQSTVMNPDFILREIDRLEVYELTDDLAREVIDSADIPAEARPYVNETLDNVLVDIRPWVREQVGVIVRTFDNYFQGQIGSINVSISLQPMRDSISQNLAETMGDLPPSVEAVALQEIDRQLDEELPASLDINQGEWDAELVSVMEQVRQYTSRAQMIIILLAAISLLLIGIVFLIYREVKTPARSLGIDFIVCGVLIYAANLATRLILSPRLLEMSLPGDFQTRLPQLIADFYFPLDVYAWVIIAVGVGLLILSIFYKPRLAD